MQASLRGRWPASVSGVAGSGSQLPDKGKGWLGANERRFEEKWGWVPAPTDPFEK
jgi:hypothetical protein